MVSAGLSRETSKQKCSILCVFALVIRWGIGYDKEGEDPPSGLSAQKGGFWMDIVLTRILECMGNRYGAGKDLANHLGISGNVITNWKNGSNRSYLKHLREIAEFYNVSESYLLGKTDIKNRPPELDDMADILSDPDIVMFARHTQKIPQADRKRILDNFRDTIDIYLTAIGIDPKEGEDTGGKE